MSFAVKEAPTPTIEEMKREVRDLLDDPRTGLKSSSNRNKTYRGIMAIIDTIDQNARERTIREIISLFEEESNKPQIRHRNYFELLDTLLSHPLNK